MIMIQWDFSITVWKPILKKDGELQPLGSVGWDIAEEKHPEE